MVGHRLQHLRRGDNRNLGAVCGADEFLLDDRYSLGRQLDAQVSARYHQPVGHSQDLVQVIQGFRLLQLGDDRDCGTQRPHPLLREPDIVGAAHEGEGDPVDAQFDAKHQVGHVLLG